MSVQLYRILALVFGIAAVVFLALAIIMFFAFKISNLLLILTKGKISVSGAARRTTELTASGALTRQSGERTTSSMGKTTGPLTGSRKQDKTANFKSSTSRLIQDVISNGDATEVLGAGNLANVQMNDDNATQVLCTEQTNMTYGDENVTQVLGSESSNAAFEEVDATQVLNAELTGETSEEEFTQVLTNEAAETIEEENLTQVLTTKPAETSGEENLTQVLTPSDRTEKLTGNEEAPLYQPAKLDTIPLRTKGNSYTIGFSTDIGTRKNVNQDSCYIGTKTVRNQEACLMVMCDGVGGLSEGEIASRSVTAMFDKWFNDKESDIMFNNFEALKWKWAEMIRDINHGLLDYGRQKQIQLGTTLTAVLMYDGMYYAAHIGDSRFYIISDSVNQISEDQTVNGSHVLLQCVGVTLNPIPSYYSGEVIPDSTVLLCSDGFVHKLEENEMLNKLNSRNCNSQKAIEERLTELIKLDMSRGETDNITALLSRVG